MTLIMSVACGVSVANIYYCQPLLSEIAQSFGKGDHAVAYLPMFTQAGVALGMFSFVPLGDIFPRRELIVTMSLATAVAALLMAVAPTIGLVNLAGFLVGLISIVPHLVIPFAAKLAPADRRGQIVGTLLGGLLMGILLARVVSGYLGDAFGWRAVYWIACGVMLTLAVAMRLALPYDAPESRMSYGQLLRSIFELVRTQPVLRESALIGATLLGSFSSFWATLVFLLGTPPYHYGPRVAGLFGLVGAAGALMAPKAGRLSDRKGPSFTISLSILVALGSFVLIELATVNIWLLVAGVVLMDLGVQAGHVANQTRIYALIPEARSRINTVYMVTYFLGGAAGSALGAFGWSHWGWSGVCVAGSGQLLIALGIRKWFRRD